jgi:hypothetical protein
MPQNYITLSRSKLYELVWTKPVTELARDFGISDVALAKRCRAINIPLPPRGYWARVAAGQKLKRPALPPFGTSSPAKRTSGAPEARERPQSASPAHLPSYVTTRGADGRPSDEPTVNFDPDRTTPGTSPVISSADTVLPTVGVAPTTSLADATDIVKRTARHYKHPNRADLTFTRGEAQGPILHVAVAPETLERALLFADTFLKAAAEQGWHLVPPEEPEPSRYGYSSAPKPSPTGPQFAELEIDGKRIQFQIEERYELRDLPFTATELARQKRDPYFRPERRTETVWSGRLRFKRPRPDYCYHLDGKSWFETKTRTLDVLIPRILADLRAVAARMQEVDEQRERERLEEERQERLRKEFAERREANVKFIYELARQAGAWHRAQFLRRYVRAARRALGAESITLDLKGQPTDFLAWAEHYIDQLDPLSATDHDSDLTPERTYYSDSDRDRLQGELRRLSGHTWDRASKLVAEPTESDDDPTADEDDPDEYWDDED